MLLLNFVLVNQADKRQAFVYFLQVQHNVGIVARRMKSDGGAGFIVEGQVASGFICSIDASYVNEDVDELWADFVVFHLNVVFVSSDVDFGNDVKQEGLLDLTCSHELVQQLLDVLDLRKELLDYSR